VSELENGGYLLQLNCLLIAVFFDDDTYSTNVKFQGGMMPLRSFTDLEEAKKAGIDYALQILRSDLDTVEQANNQILQP
jgi:hypothetical protein